MKSKLPTTLRALDAAIKKSYPRKHASLEKPASKKTVDALEKGFGQPLPAAVRALYAWHGRAEALLVDRRDKAGDQGYDLDEPAVVLESYRAWRGARRAAKSWKPSWLPLFGNGAGDNVCLDVDSGKLIEALHEDDDARAVVAKSLDEAMAYVLQRVKAGTWRGTPESKQVTRMIRGFEEYHPEKKGPGFESMLGGNELYLLLKSDPAGVLSVMEAAEKRLAALPHLEIGWRARFQGTIHGYRARAQAALGQAEAAHASYRALLATARKAGCILDLDRVGQGFEKLKQRAWADDVAEVLAMEQARVMSDSPYGGRVASSVLQLWLAAEARFPDTDGSTYRADGMMALVEDMDGGIAAAKDGASRARCCAIKAAALRELGRKAEAGRAWAAAIAADRRLGEFWRAHPLIA